MPETWKPIPGYEDAYEVSDLGRVRSLERLVPARNGSTRRQFARILRPSPLPTGHLHVSLSRNGKGRSYTVHRLVLLAFIGPPRRDQECCHRDGNPSNNALTNLYWGTRTDNRLDDIRNGRHPQARKDHCPSGHPYSDSNTYHIPSRPGWRYCRACQAARRKKEYTS